MPGPSFIARAPGRVNLIGDHTDYVGGLAMPIAIDRETTVRGTRGGDLIHLTSVQIDEPLTLSLPVGDPTNVDPSWGRYVAGVAAELANGVGFTGQVDSTVPVGSGLSSSAALELAVALALGATGTPLALAQLCQRAENRASGVPTGIMDQLASAAGVAGHALVIDCHDLSVTPVPVPVDADIVVIHSGQTRALTGSAYGERVAQCAAAEAVIGPLRLARPGAEDAITDPLVRARARHVISENQRVRDFADALTRNDLAAAGRIMVASHRSLATDYEVSTAVLDTLVDRLVATPGVFGARVTGAGFGGCVVALTAPGVLDEGWTVRAVDGASVTTVN